MPTINQLNSIDSPSAADLLALYSQSSGDARKLSLSNLLNWIEGNIAPSGSVPQLLTQRSVPSSSGFNVSIEDASNSIWLILTPTGTLASGTITLPAVTNCIDQQEVLVNTTQTVTSLTVSGNGATSVTGAPTTLSANAFFRLRFDFSTKIWYRVG